MLKPVDNLLVGCGEGTTILKKNLKKINLGKNIFWKHVSVPGIEVHILLEHVQTILAYFEVFREYFRTGTARKEACERTEENE